MTQDDLLRCPLLRGLDAMHRAELIGLLSDSKLEQEMENCLGRMDHCECTSTFTGKTQPQDLPEEKTWNPDAQIWRQGAQE
jgi:hypothetical protein